MRAIAVVIALLPVLSACVPVSYRVDELTDASRTLSEADAAEHFDRLETLTELLRALGPDVDPGEAAMLAEVALVYPMELADRYRLTQPAITHNFLVNVGLKARGLCVHWTEDLLVRLKSLDLQTMELYWGVANPERPWRLQHSTPVVTARGAPFESGVLLDGWRDSGRLFFARVPDDERYAWQLHFNASDRPIPATD